ncbi:MAG: DUF6603 domain-containing protein [Paracoccus sp. (in: a-proteobacteria)]|uniref:DUF6603 domain-containing protein n=1 Tax=Paracoccus sp. TaxID=267 RepID=UPI00391A538B
MTADVFSAFGRGFVAFAHTRAADLVGDSFSDSGKLITSLADGKTGTTKTAFEAVKADMQQLGAVGEAIRNAIDREITDAKAGVAEMAAELARDSFGAGEVLRALTALGKVLTAYDTAIGKIADEVSKKAAGSMSAEQIKADINGMHAPIRKLLGDASGGATANIDAFCKLVLNVDNAAGKFGDKLDWDYAEKRLQIAFASAGPGSLAPLEFDGASLVAFFTYKTDVKAGIEVMTRLKAGLRNDTFLEKIMPGQPPAADADKVAITLDTKDGLTFGSGKNKRLTLPVRFSYPGVELREFAIELPPQDNAANRNRVNLVFTVAGKLGDVFAVVVEGGGLSVRWVDGGPPEITPKPPSGAGLRLQTPLVTGGGYLRYDEVRKEFGALLQLEVMKFGVTAFGLIGTDPFSLVIVIGMRFPTKLELGYGFTLSGLGGILAIERSLDSDALRAGLKDGIVGQLLFPSDPVAAAPQLLNQLSRMFPPRAGGFVIGPIAELGWGSQAGFVKARVGIILSLPDPRVVLLGAVQIGVPSADVDEKLRVVDLRAELYGEVTADYFLIRVSLAKSRIFTLEVTGDICIFIKWAGEGAFVLSVGGFFPGYEAPREIGTMDRLAIKFAPPVKWLTIGVQAYVAITSNTVQFGGRLDLVARLPPAKAEAWLQLDALFQWSPHFYFIIQIDAGIKVSAFGKTLAGVRFRGELSGDKPWRLQGYAEVTILFWDVPVDIGPIEWGQKAPAPAPELDPMALVASALTADEAWTPLLPPDALSLLRLAPTIAADLHHPVGQIQLRQIAVPLEMDIDRIGSGKSTRRRLNLGNARLGAGAAGAVWPLTDRFAPGHFLELTTAEVLARPEFEERASGLGMGATRGASFSTGVHCAYRWNTVCPNEDFAPPPMQWKLGKLSSQVLADQAKMRGMRANPYVTGPRPEELVITPRGEVGVVSTATMGRVMDRHPASDAAAVVRAGLRDGIGLASMAAGFM